MALPPVHGSPVDPSKKAEGTKKVGGEEAKNPNVSELRQRLGANIPMGRPAPIKKAVQEAPPKEEGPPVGDSGIKLPPPPERRPRRGRMPLPDEKFDTGPLPPSPFGPPSVEVGPPPRDLPPALPKAEEPPPARAGRALPKMPAQAAMGAAMLGGLGESKLFKEKQDLHNPGEAKKYLNKVAEQHGYEFVEDGSFFMHLKTQDIVSTDEFKVIMAQQQTGRPAEDTSGDYDLAVRLQNEEHSKGFDQIQARLGITPGQHLLNAFVREEAERQGYKLSPAGHFYKGSLETPDDIKLAEDFYETIRVRAPFIGTVEQWMKDNAPVEDQPIKQTAAEWLAKTEKLLDNAPAATQPTKQTAAEWLAKRERLGAETEKQMAESKKQLEEMRAGDAAFQQRMTARIEEREARMKERADRVNAPQLSAEDFALINSVLGDATKQGFKLSTDQRYFYKGNENSPEEVKTAKDFVKEREKKSWW